jgi:pyridoxal phosphate enzyme (YggS family)
MIDIANKLRAVTAQLPPHVRLLAVSKTFDAAAVQAAWDAGQRAFGENYVQEAIAKIDAFAVIRANTEWHLIGPLQSNKTAVVAQHFDWVQTIDRLKIAQRLSEQRPSDLPPLSVCIQINVDGGKNKSGLAIQNADDLQALLDMARQIGGLPRLILRGLLAIPEPQVDPIKQKAVFAKVRAAFDFLNHNGCKLDTLSMGMSADFEAAIAAGSTMVRVGSGIFGSR